jgi:hypothetical protein
LKLIAFPLKHENPFPVRLRVGEPVKLDENTMILCTGIGSKGSEILGKVLFNYPEVEKVIEFGSAANVSKGRIGSIYECTLFLNYDGSVLGTSGRTTKLPVTAVTGNDELYIGGGFNWSEELEFPLIYTMETLVFRNVAEDFRKEFVSLRIVTDDGTGDIRAQVTKQINLSKKRVRTLFEKIKCKD